MNCMYVCMYVFYILIEDEQTGPFAKIMACFQDYISFYMLESIIIIVI